MKAIPPTAAQLKVLRDIAAAGFAYGAAKRLCAAAGWELVWDEPNTGFIQYSLCLGANPDDQRLLSIGTPELEKHPPHVLLPLFYFDEPEDIRPANRVPFDEAYLYLAEALTVMLDAAARWGDYVLSHRPGWPYKYRAWSLGEAHVLLLQDEHDIPFGMDVSLWLFPSGANVSVPPPF
jgi:hypothetical protein